MEESCISSYFNVGLFFARGKTGKNKLLFARSLLVSFALFQYFFSTECMNRQLQTSDITLSGTVNQAKSTHASMAHLAIAQCRSFTSCICILEYYNIYYSSEHQKPVMVIFMDQNCFCTSTNRQTVMRSKNNG